MTDSYLFCCECQQAFTDRQVKLLLYPDTPLRCKGCGLKQYLHDVEARIADDCLRFTKKQAVLDATWYHISRWGDLDTNLKPGRIIHVGTPATVREYRRLECAKLGSKWIYQFKFISGTKIATKINHDYDNWAGEEGEIKAGWHDVQRYINRYESPGQISLLCNPEALECVGKTRNKIPRKNYAMA